MGLVCIASARKRPPLSRPHALRERLARLENLVSNISVGGQVPSLSPQGVPEDAEHDEESDASAGTHSSPVQTTSPTSPRPFAPDFFFTLADEMHALNEILDDTDDSNEEEDVPSVAPDRNPGFILCNPSSLQFAPEEPNAAMSHDLMDYYFEYVEPLYKVFHSPTLKAFAFHGSPYLDQPANAPCNRALRTAIHYAAVSAMTEEDRKLRYGQLGEHILHRLRSTVDLTLAQADLVCTTELATLQAFGIYVASARFTSPSKWSWTMTSLLIRIATSLGLDHETKSDSVYLTELKRRLWHFIYFLDTFYALDRASEPIMKPGVCTTPLPLNVNDSDFDPSSECIKPRVDEVTDMTYALLLYELSEVIHHLCSTETETGPTGKTWEARLSFTQQRMSYIERTHLRPCDSSIPFQRVILATAHAAHSSMVLRAVRPTQRHMSSKPPRVDSVWVLQLAVDHLRRVHSLWTDSVVAKWNRIPWVPWHAIAVTLAGLCSIRGSKLADEGWYLVERTMRIYEGRVADEPGGMMWKPIQKLHRKAKAFRDSGSVQKSSVTPSSDVLSVDVAQDKDQWGLNVCQIDPLLQEQTNFEQAFLEPITMDMDNFEPGEESWLQWEDAIQDMRIF